MAERITIVWTGTDGVMRSTPPSFTARRQVQTGDRVFITAGQNANRFAVIEKYLGICDTRYTWHAMVRFEDDGSVVKEWSGRLEYVGN